MSNSGLICYTRLSPNCNKPRNHVLDTITIHHMAGNLSVEACGEIFAQPSRKASSNYGVGSDGRIALYVDESNRSWCSSSPENDHRAVTIEVANCGGEPDWPVSDKAYAALLDLVTDICRRNGIKKLRYTGDKTGNLTMHKWFAATACPGPYLESRFPAIAAEVNRRLSITSKAGWAQDTLGWYWYEAGEKARSKWIKDGGYWYYLGPDGRMLTGLQRIGGKLYMLNPYRKEDMPAGACIITDGSGAISAPK